MSLAIKYGLGNTVSAIIVSAILIAMNPSSSTIYGSLLTAPFAIFICGFFFWKFLVRGNKYKRGRIALTGLLTGTVSHYLAFTLLHLGSVVCIFINPNCPTFPGVISEEIATSLDIIVSMSFYSIAIFGWLTVPFAVLFGFSLNR